MSKPRQTQVQIEHDEAYWRNKLEELGVKFDEIVAEVLKIDFERRSNPYESIANAISQYIYDATSKLYSLVDLLESGMGESGVLHVLAKLEDIADDMKTYAKNIRKTLSKARE
jgi:DNA-binding transcriptional regulator WhiA